MWLRIVARKIFGRIMGHKQPEQAQKYMDVMRILYFLSASSLGIYYYHTFVKNESLCDISKQDIENDLLMGKPVIEDFSPTYKRLREKGVKTATINEYVPGEGMRTIEYNRDLYLQELEKRAFKRAQDAQRKALEEGKELPKTAIRLVE